MSDAQIFDEMRDRQLNAYLEEQDRFSRSAEEAYDACLEMADTELQEHYDAIAKVISQLAKQYGFTAREIYEDMVLPSLEATL